MSTNSSNVNRIEHRPLGEGFVTVAYQYDSDAEQLHYALSFCSPLDQFSRKRGYTIADGRLNTYRSTDKVRVDKLVNRGLAGSIPASSEPKKKAAIDNVIGIVTSRALPDERLRWVLSAVGQ